MSSDEGRNAMKFTRREFLRIGASAAAVGAASYLLPGRFPVLPASTGHAAVEGVETRKYTVCSLCPSGCGLDVRVVDGRVVKVEGNALHPVNQGVCCPKGQAALEMLYSPERLPGPMRRKKQHGTERATSTVGDWERIS